MNNTWERIDKTAEFEDISPRAVRKKLKKYTTRKVPSVKNKGKMVPEILVASWSDKGKRNWLKMIRDKAVQSGQDSEVKVQGSRVQGSRVQGSRVQADQGSIERLSGEEMAAWYSGLPAVQRKVVDERLQVITDYRLQIADCRFKNNNPLTPFIKGEFKEKTYFIKGEFARLFCKRQGISTGTLYRWQARYEKHGLIGLAPFNFGHKRTKLNNEMTNYIVGLYVWNNDMRPGEMYRHFSNKYSPVPVAGITVARYFKKWKKNNEQLCMLLENPEKWKATCLVSLGNASEKAIYVNHYWELDSTRADVMCSDGKRYTLVGCIDIYSRRAIILVVPTSNSKSIAEILRSGILKWGVPDTLVVDNGKDYKSNHIQSICGSLNIHMDIVPPFSPEKKPHIERFFKTLGVGLFEGLNGYIGHNVIDRKKIDSRITFAQRFMKSGETVELNTTREKLQKFINLWIERYGQKEHGGKGMGMPPVVKAAQSPEPVRTINDERALDILLTIVEKRKIKKNGIEYECAYYWANKFFDFMGDEVNVRPDPLDAGKLHVFTLEGKFICTGIDVKRLGIDAQKASVARSTHRKIMSQKRRAIRTYKVCAETPLEKELLSDKEIKKIAAFNRKVEAEIPAIHEAAKAVNDEPGVRPQRLMSIGEQMEMQGSGSMVGTRRGVPVQAKDIPDQAGDDIEEDDAWDWLDDVEIVQPDEAVNEW